MEVLSVSLFESCLEPRILSDKYHLRSRYFVFTNLGQLPTPDVVHLRQLLHVAFSALALPVNEEPVLIHSVRNKNIS